MTDVELRVPPTPSRRPRGRWLIVLSLVALVALVAGGLSYWRWHNGAADLFAYSGIGGTSAPLAVGATLYVNAEIQPRATDSGHRVLDVHRVSPHVVLGDAGATVRLLTCRVADPTLGMGDGPDTAPCAAVADFHPGRLDLGFPATEIIYKITATRSGTMTIRGADVDYGVDGRHGAQHAGSKIVIHIGS